AGFRLGDSQAILPAEAVPEKVRSSKQPIRMGVRPRDLQLIDGAAPIEIELPVEDVFSVGRERFFTFKIGDGIAQGVDVRAEAHGPANSIGIRPEGLKFFDAQTGHRIMTHEAAA
ncbi:MAG: hypothetical protein V7703_16390, partial [Hyphomicrobiales bacterium]